MQRHSHQTKDAQRIHKRINLRPFALSIINQTQSLKDSKEITNKQKVWSGNDNFTKDDFKMKHFD